MESVATLTMPQAPRPVAKNVPSPEKGPSAPDGGDGAAALVAGGAGCWCGVEEEDGAGAGVKLAVGEWVVSGATMGEGVGTVEEDAEEEGR